MPREVLDETSALAYQHCVCHVLLTVFIMTFLCSVLSVIIHTNQQQVYSFY